MRAIHDVGVTMTALPPATDDEWRRLAEARLQQNPLEIPVPLTLAEVPALVHELLIQQTILALHNEELRVTQQQAQTVSNARAKYLATMSHEIRTPMNGILGLTELLLTTPLTAEQEDFAHTVYRSAESLLTVLNDILDFSKIDAGKLILEAIAFDPRTAVFDSVHLFRTRLFAEHQATSAVELLVRIDPALPQMLIGDPDRWRQILANLIGNAVKFTTHGHVLVDLSWHANSLVLNVSDTGIGIPAERLPHLFTPFVQAESSTSRRFGGTGLGLAITRDLCQLMGGTISVASVPGLGSTLSVCLPLAMERQAAAPAATAGMAGLRVLVIDDNVVHCRIICEQLVHLQMRAEWQTELNLGLAVISAAHSEDDPVAAVFIDRYLANFSEANLATAVAVANHGRNLPIILMSAAMTSSGDVPLAAPADATRPAIAGYLTKPVRLEVLNQVLAAAIVTAAAQRHEPPPPMSLREINHAYSAFAVLRTRMVGNHTVANAMVKIQRESVTALAMTPAISM